MSRWRRQLHRRHRDARRAAKLDAYFNGFIDSVAATAMELAFKQLVDGIIVLDEVVPFDWPKWTFKSGRTIRFAGTSGGGPYSSMAPMLHERLFPTIHHETPRAPRNVGDEYTCEECGGTFTSGWTAEEAAAEATALFGAETVRTGALVCDDCFTKLTGRGTA